MLPFVKLSAKQTIFVVVFCIGGLLWGYQSWSKPHRYEQSETAQQSSQFKIAKDTDMVQVLHYTQCNDEKVVREKVNAKLIGMDIKQLQELYPQAVVTRFDEQEVSLLLPVDGYCQEHAKYSFLGAKDGFVVVFRGVPGNKALVKEFTPIPITSLLPQDVEELQRGVPITSNAELLRTLEGLQSR